MTEYRIAKSLADIADMFNCPMADHPYGEAVTTKEHMLQCALFGEQHGDPDNVVIAALLHDIGHFAGDPDGTKFEDGIDDKHEEIGANCLSEIFPPCVTEPLRLHVAAKRYLCTTDPSYHFELSDSSKATLLMQGGPMGAEEAAQFEKHPFFKDAIAVRKLDELGKVAGLQTKTLDDYMPLMAALLKRPPLAASLPNTGTVSDHFPQPLSFWQIPWAEEPLACSNSFVPWACNAMPLTYPPHPPPPFLAGPMFYPSNMHPHRRFWW